MKLNRDGATRWVITTRKYAFKVPGLYSWKQFLQGLLANMQERAWRGQHPALAKIYYANRFGLLVIMEYAEPCFKIIMRDSDHEEDLRKGVKVFDVFNNMIEKEFANDELGSFLLLDNKATNWGIATDGRRVKIDYGNW